MPSPSGTITAIACTTPGFETLCSLLQLTGLDVVLSDPNSNFTVFAPTNDAFDAIADVTSTLTVEQIAQILLYHAVEGEIFSSGLVCDAFVTMLNGLLTQTQCQAIVQIRQDNNINNTLFFQVGTGNNPSMLPQIVAFDVDAINGT